MRRYKWTVSGARRRIDEVGVTVALIDGRPLALCPGARLLDTSLLLYPVYYCLANGALAVLIYYRRSRLASRQRTSSPAGGLR